jgi:hypothetical protein
MIVREKRVGFSPDRGHQKDNRQAGGIHCAASLEGVI